MPHHLFIYLPHPDSIVVILIIVLLFDGFGQLSFCHQFYITSTKGALSATVHSCMGSILAAYWRTRDNKRRQEGGGDDNDNQK